MVRSPNRPTVVAKMPDPNGQSSKNKILNEYPVPDTSHVPKIELEPDAPTISPEVLRIPREGESPVMRLYLKSTPKDNETLPESFPERVSLRYTAHRYPEEISWFQQAMLHNDLQWTLLGTLSALVTKGTEGVVHVVDIVSPSLIPGANFYCSKHGNWHVGTVDGVTNTSALTLEQLRELNSGNYSYFQNSQFFMAVRSLTKKNGVQQLLMYVFKKPPLAVEPRAQQD